jgi:hypothetical protein
MNPSKTAGKSMGEWDYRTRIIPRLWPLVCVTQLIDRTKLLRTYEELKFRALRNIRPRIKLFFRRFVHNLPPISHRQVVAEQYVLRNTMSEPRSQDEFSTRTRTQTRTRTAIVYKCTLRKSVHKNMSHWMENEIIKFLILFSCFRCKCTTVLLIIGLHNF